MTAPKSLNDVLTRVGMRRLALAGLSAAVLFGATDGHVQASPNTAPTPERPVIQNITDGLSEIAGARVTLNVQAHESKGGVFTSRSNEAAPRSYAASIPLMGAYDMCISAVRALGGQKASPHFGDGSESKNDNVRVAVTATAVCLKAGVPLAELQQENGYYMSLALQLPGSKRGSVGEAAIAGWHTLQNLADVPVAKMLEADRIASLHASAAIEAKGFTDMAQAVDGNYSPTEPRSPFAMFESMVGSANVGATDPETGRRTLHTMKQAIQSIGHEPPRSYYTYMVNGDAESTSVQKTIESLRSRLDRANTEIEAKDVVPH